MQPVMILKSLFKSISQSSRNINSKFVFYTNEKGIVRGQRTIWGFVLMRTCLVELRSIRARCSSQLLYKIVSNCRVGHCHWPHETFSNQINKSHGDYLMPIFLQNAALRRDVTEWLALVVISVKAVTAVVDTAHFCPWPISHIPKRTSDHLFFLFFTAALRLPSLLSHRN